MKADNPNKARAELESIEALLTAMKSGADSGLAMLKNKTDPDSMKRRLFILLQAGRAIDAAELVRNQKTEELWANLAIQAFGAIGEIDKAEEIFKESKNFGSQVKRKTCILAFAAAVFGEAFRVSRREGNSSDMPFEKSMLVRVNDVLLPVLTSIDATDQIETELEQQAAEIAVRTFHFLGAADRCERFVRLLDKRKPVPLIIGDAVLGRWIRQIPKDLSGRLRRDYPSQFDPILKAVAIEGMENPLSAIENAQTLEPITKTSADRFRLWRMLEILVERSKAPMPSDAAVTIALLESKDAMLAGFRSAETLISGGKMSEARQILGGIEVNTSVPWCPYWADLIMRCGDVETGFSTLEAAAKVFPDPELYERLAALALNSQDYQKASRFLQRLLSLEPDNISARQQLAFALLNTEHLGMAATEFGELRRLQPNEPSHAMNQALTLRLVGKPHRSIEILDEMCNAENAPVEAFICRSEILKAENRAANGFAGLRTVQNIFWDDPRFVAAYMDLAYAAQQDRAGHDALMRLQELQSQGKVTGLLQSVSINDLTSRIEEFEQKKSEIFSLSIEGKVPWILVEQLLGRVPHLGWYLRTQPIYWIPEERLTFASRCIYSTNSFKVVEEQNAQKHLVEIDCPVKSTPIVCDLSALITLSQLGLLEKAASYFGRILIPSSYLQRTLKDSANLVLNQKSQKSFLDVIKKYVDTGKIRIYSAMPSNPETSAPLVNDYDLLHGGDHAYRLRDLAQTLVETGQVSKAACEEIFKYCNPMTGVDAVHPQLKCSQAVRIALPSLCTLYSFSKLDNTVDAFEVFLSESDWNEVVRESKGFEALETAYQSYREMWENIRADKRFAFCSRKIALWRDVEKSDLAREDAIAAFKLAQEQKLPLLVDDRTCQAIAINERQDMAFSAFGTDALLSVLAHEGLIDSEEEAKAFLSLIEWRYRFIVIPSKVLLHLAHNFQSNPPGRSLHLIARYVHACMCDPGLFAGFENVDPPMPMASRLFYKWASVAAEFIIRMWADNAVTTEVARKYTNWAVAELLPSAPKSLPPAIAEVLVSMIPKIVLSHALVHSAASEEHKRINQGLVTISESLGITTELYNKIMMEAINAIRE